MIAGQPGPQSNMSATKGRHEALLPINSQKRDPSTRIMLLLAVGWFHLAADVSPLGRVLHSLHAMFDYHVAL